MIPEINDLQSITIEQVDSLRKTGIAFVKLPDAILEDLKKIEKYGMRYFHQPKSFKNLDKFNQYREGYLDQSEKGYPVERYITRGVQMSEALVNCQAEMLNIREFFKADIILPLVFEVFKQLNITSHFEVSTKEPDYTLSLIYYPAGELEVLRLTPHKDTILMTVVWTQKMGFEAKIAEQWHSLIPKEGYAIVQIGQALELMTNGQCHAVEHRVKVEASDERFSMATFLSSNAEMPFKNLITDELLSERFGDYVKHHVAQVYKSK